MPEGSRCLREPVRPRPNNALSWEVFCFAFGETSGFTDAPVDMGVVIKALEAHGLSGAGLLDAQSRIKLLSAEYRVVAKAIEEQKKRREEFQKRFRDEARTRN